MKNFKNERYPNLEIIKTFDKKINQIVNNIAKNATVIEVLKDKQEIIPEKGAYFFYDTDLEEKRIVYVGISRNIKLRLQQHSNYKNANSASLAYLMAKNDRKNIPPKEVRECFEKTKEEKNCRIYYYM